MIHENVKYVKPGIDPVICGEGMNINVGIIFFYNTIKNNFQIIPGRNKLGFFLKEKKLQVFHKKGRIRWAIK